MFRPYRPSLVRVVVNCLVLVPPWVVSLALKWASLLVIVLGGTPVKTGRGPGIGALVIRCLSLYGRMALLSPQLLATTGHAKFGPLRLLILLRCGSGENMFELFSVLQIPRDVRGRNGVRRRPVLHIVRVVIRSIAFR